MKPKDHIKIPNPKVGVILVNLGTPEATNYKSMWIYLREFLSDKRIIELTRVIWYPILYCIILYHFISFYIMLYYIILYHT